MTLQATNVHKWFGGTRAVDGVSVAFPAACVTALVGENGAGKSTLLKTIAGVHRADGGRFLLDGKPYDRSTSVAAARSGVALVLQESTVHPNLSIAENVFVDRLRDFRRRCGLLDRHRLRRDAAAILDRIGAAFAPERRIDTLNPAERKIVEIARALSYDPRFVFLDESTAVMSAKETRLIFKTIDRLRAAAIGVVFVSHHLSEVFRIADRVIVLKDAHLVASGLVSDFDRPKIESLMVGRPLGSGIVPRIAVPAEPSPLLQVRHLSARRSFDAVSFSVAAGEILGIAGLSGSGGDRLLRAIYGDLPTDAGTMLLDGKRYAPRNPGQALAHGVGYVPGDRINEGAISQLSVRMNISVATIPRRGPFIDTALETTRVETARKTFAIKAKTIDARCSTLSGGNLQKVVIAKCLHTSPRVLLLDNPTRGIDVGARSEIYALIKRLAEEERTAIVLSSEDLLEVLGLSHRIIVMKKGKLAKAFSPAEGDITEERVITHMV